MANLAVWNLNEDGGIYITDRKKKKRNAKGVKKGTFFGQQTPW